MKEGILIEGSTTRTRQSASTQLGERVRQLRVAAGLTQTELAGDRFSKEYISQIERGKTRPTQETVEWLALRLRTDAGYVANGVQTLDLARAETQLAQAEALAAGGQHTEAAEQFAAAQRVVLETGLSELEFRRLTGEAWSRMEAKEIRTGVDMLVAAQKLPAFETLADVERAEYNYRLGVGRYKLGSISIALSLLSDAHKLAEASITSDVLRVQILRWRSICLQRLRDLDLAREDAERAVELGQHTNDPRVLGDALYQASVVAYGEARYTLARRYAEQARERYADANERVQLGKTVNVLGAVHFLLENYDEALQFFKDSYRTLIDEGADDLCGPVISSMAQVQLAQGNPAAAAESAETAIKMYSGNPEWLQELGESRYILGKARLELGELDDAEAALKESAAELEQAESHSSLSRTVLAQGDLAAARGDQNEAARLYRRSAAMLQDVHF